METGCVSKQTTKLMSLLAVSLMGGVMIAALLVVLAPRSAQAQGTIYVDADATGNHDGTTWTDAFTNVQDALADATSGDQIWVAAGVYYPDEGTGQTNDARTSTFQLASGVALYGGFDPSAGADTFGERDWETYVTVLSGDLDQDDITDANDVVTHTTLSTNTNAYHVVTGSDVDRTALLDGFTITAGRADGGGQNEERGGGMYVSYGSPTLVHVTIIGNYAKNWSGGTHGNRGHMALTDVIYTANHANGYPGGGMGNFVSNPVLTNVLFYSNTARLGGGMWNYSSAPKMTWVTFTVNASLEGSGGAMFNESDCSPELNHVAFIDNSAPSTGFGVGGGGMYSASSSPILTDVAFISNTAKLGGGMYSCYGGSPVLNNVTFHGNTAESGAGMHNSAVTPTLTLVTFTHNTASSNGGGIYSSGGSATLSQVTFAHNTAQGEGGGGMYVREQTMILDRGSFISNTASGTWGAGGGVYLMYAVTARFTNARFGSNHANYEGGGMGVLINCFPTLVNVTLSGNSAGDRGGGLSNGSSSNTVLNNTILWGNTASTGDQVYTLGPLTISHSLAQDSGGSGVGWDTSLGTDGGGNLDADPLFVDVDGADDIAGTLDDDLHLMAASPAINHGDNDALPGDITVDLDGGPRIDSGCVDMGPYEYIWSVHAYLPLVLRSN